MNRLVPFGIVSLAILLGQAQVLVAQQPVFGRLDAAATPGSTLDAGCTFQTHSRRMLVFGGTDAANVLLSETWEFSVDGGWVRRTPATVPPARRAPAMAYDEARGLTYMFGGITATGLTDDLWHWDGTNWQQQSFASRPPVRYAAAMATHPASNRVVLYGGRGPQETPLDDTWVYAPGAGWNQHNGMSPVTLTGRANVQPPSMALDRSTGHVCLMGPQVVGASREVLDWSGGGWSMRNRTQSGWFAYTLPTSACFETPWGVLFSDTSMGARTAWLLTTTSQAQVPWTSPTESGLRRRACEAFDPFSRTLVVFGGEQATLAQPNVFAPRTDTLLVSIPSPAGATHRPFGYATQPPARAHHTASNFGALTLLFGGLDGAGGALGDTWLSDGQSWVQYSMTTRPVERFSGSMAYVGSRQVAVLFGGRRGTQSRQDTWEWNGSSWLQTATSGTRPAARFGHAMCYDEVRDRVVLFGGRSSGDLDDTWEYNPAFATWQDVTGSRRAPPRTAHAMVHDRQRNQTILFGGTSGGVLLGDQWRYDPTQGWLTSPFGWSGPSARREHAMTFDPSRGVTVLVGGYGDPANPRALDDVWEWNGAAWQQQILGSDRPSPREGASLTMDGVKGHLLLFGGDQSGNGGNQNRNDAWSYVQRTESPGVGQVTGSRVPMRLRKVGLAGGYEPMVVDFPSPAGVAWIAVSLLPLQHATSTNVSMPGLCGSANLFLSNQLMAVSVGSMAELSLNVPTWLRGVGITFQGFYLDPNSCFGVTDPRIVAVQ